MLTMNRNMTWGQMVKEFPDKWVVLSSHTGWGPDIETGNVIAVLSDDEYDDYAIAHLDDNYYIKRTTYEEFGGFVSGEGDGFKAV